SLSICLPPISPLFPYTTLFRSGQSSTKFPSPERAAEFFNEPPQGHIIHGYSPSFAFISGSPFPSSTSANSLGDVNPDVRAGGLRSEEHTSELQSLAYLVCRLLL